MRHMMLYIRLLQWFSVRQLARHPWRVLTVLFGIALGAAVFTTVRLAADASLDSFTASMDLLSGKADWVVVRPGGRISEDLVAKLKGHPAVAVASPLITTYVRVSDGDPEPFLLIGLDPVLDAPLRTWRIRSEPENALRLWLDLIRVPGSMVASGPLARRYGVEPPQGVVLEHVHQVQSFTVIGVLEPHGLALVESSHVAVADIATVQEFIGSHGWVDRIDLMLQSHSGPQEIRDLREWLPAGVVLRSPAETKETGQAMIHAYQRNLSVLSFVSLFVGMFLVYSVISMNAASRRGEIAILRSLGASSRLVFGAVLAEGVIMGALGWLLAIPIGSLLVRYVVGGVSSTVTNLFVRVRVEGLKLDAWEILLSLAVTLSVCLAAAYRPARESMRVQPREAMVMHEAPAGIHEPWGQWVPAKDRFEP